MPDALPANFHSLPGPGDIFRAVLPNGIVILSRANFSSPSLVLRGSLLAGALFDPQAQLGLADFTALGLMRGTAQRPFQDIYESLESVGASLSLSGGTHTTAFSGRALAEDLELLFNLLAEVLRQPVFPLEQVERLRAQLLTSLAMRLQDTGEMAALTFDQIVYQDHPYSRPEDGYPETIQAIQRQHLASFHQKHYGPRGMLLAVVGAVQPDRVQEIAAAVLGDWKNPDQPEPPALPGVAPLEGVIRRQVSIAGKSQADIVLGAAGPSRFSDDYLAALLGNDILGQFGMMGRIGEALREKSGLAYHASSSLSGGLGPGPWDINAGVHPDDLESAIRLSIMEIQRFVNEPVSEGELADTKANFIGRLPLSMESNFGVASALLSLERYQLGLDYYQRFPDLVQSINREQVLQAARHYLHPERLAIAIAGP